MHTLEIKIIDFDLAQKITKQNRGYSRQLAGSSFYMSPEILRNSKYSMEKNDVWQLGVVLYILQFSGFPFNTGREILNLNILSKINLINSELNRVQSDEIIHLLSRMLSKDPNLRPTLDEILDEFY